MARSTAHDYAYRVGRQARIEHLTIKDANVRLAYKLNWIRRDQFDDALLDECERGWYAEDELRNPEARYE